MGQRSDEINERVRPPTDKLHSLFHSLVTAADEGVVVLDDCRVCCYSNPAAEFLLARPRVELIGEMFGLPLVSGASPVRVNVVSGDGRMRVIQLRIEPMAGGPSDYLVLRLKDITDLHHDVLNARDQVRRRDEFLAMLSHELRNPLAAICSATELLTRAEAEPGVRREASEVFQRQFGHLTRILDDLLDVSRISQGKLELRRERVELGRVIRDGIEAADVLVRRGRHTLQTEIPEGRLWVLGDATRLEQVVVNLLNNAAKFTPPGGHLHVRVAAAAGEAEVFVRDNGTGIPADLLPRIFEPFVQGQQPLDRSSSGLGIGLALARNIVELHGGAISVAANADGPGVTFAIRLPILREQGEQSAPKAGGKPGHLRVVLVEDQEDSRSMLRKMLELDGHEVLEAADGPVGLATILQHDPDVALVDIGLPGMDGYEVARRTRREVSGSRVRLIALTGYGMPRDIQVAKEAGFDAHLTKPLRYPELCRLLTNVPPGRDGAAGDGAAAAP